MAASVAVLGNIVKGALRHDAIRIERGSTANLASSSTNAALIRRLPPPELAAACQHQHHEQQLLSTHLHRRATEPAATRSATLLPDQPERAAEALVQDLTLPALQRAIYDDVCSVSRTLSAALPRLRGRGLRAKLEVITRQSCPRFHADSVGVRCLCTYEGPGTWVVANRFVKRKWSLDGTVAVVAVDEAAAEQVQAWDLLYLKGNAFPGLYGMGAVHKSPEGASEASPRLLLTIDDTPSCSCCSHP